MRVFVYGTLMRGNSNHRYLKGCEFLGEAELKDFALYNVKQYAGIKPRQGFTVKGEVFEADEAARARLDKLEEEGSLYTAQHVSVTLNGGEACGAFVYVYNLEVNEDSLVPAEMQPWERVRR